MLHVLWPDIKNPHKANQVKRFSSLNQKRKQTKKTISPTPPLHSMAESRIEEQYANVASAVIYHCAYEQIVLAASSSQLEEFQVSIVLQETWLQRKKMLNMHKKKGPKAKGEQNWTWPGIASAVISLRDEQHTSPLRN